MPRDNIHSECVGNTHVFPAEPTDDRPPGCCLCGQVIGVREAAKPHVELARDGFHRIGRLCDAGRRSLWLREEADAFELRAGREGDDAHVRVTSEHPMYRELSEVLSAARFAAEYEQRQGLALDESYALDRHPDSRHRSKEN